MGNVVVDTNVIVSGFKSPNGNPAKIVDMIKNLQLTACYNAEILNEYQKVLARPHFNFSKEDRKNFLAVVIEYGLLHEPPKSTFPMIDEKDRCFYDVAVYFGAKLITGNMKHYPVEGFVVSPTGFLADL
ncbi:MAG: putative toxin-antitoxin system toxin component, PIN family [Defluviitaleaceae bacterium]|nr:putative toxin-antitoxin system toxin component, PIN family [Defluviitaleaceae bacterium]